MNLIKKSLKKKKFKKKKEVVRVGKIIKSKYPTIIIYMKTPIIPRICNRCLPIHGPPYNKINLGRGQSFGDRIFRGHKV